MKRIANLYDQIINVDNLKATDKKARRGKSRQYGVIKHLLNEEENILLLHDLLKDNEFENSPYSTFTIKEPKERIIYRLPYYPDRIVQAAINQFSFLCLLPTLIPVLKAEVFIRHLKT